MGGRGGVPANGAVSNLTFSWAAAAKLRNEIRMFKPDAVHLHEPIAPLPCWDVLCATNTPLVGTFHCYSTSFFTNWSAANLLGCRRRLNRLAVRVAVSQAAAWTGKRYYGGHYRVIPNGVDLFESSQLTATSKLGNEFQILFVGQAVERKRSSGAATFFCGAP